MLLLSCPDHLIIILLPLWDHFRSRSYHLRTIWSSCCYHFRTLWSSCSSSDYSILMLLLPSSDHFFIVLLCPSSDRFSFILLLYPNRLMYMLLLPSSNHLKFTLLHHLWFNFHFHTIWPSCYFLSYIVWFPHYFHFNTIGSPYSHRIFEPLDFHTVTPSHNLFFQHPQFVFLRHRFIWPHYENPPKETPFSLRVSRISIKSLLIHDRSCSRHEQLHTLRCCDSIWPSAALPRALSTHSRCRSKQTRFVGTGSSMPTARIAYFWDRNWCDEFRSPTVTPSAHPWMSNRKYIREYGQRRHDTLSLYLTALRGEQPLERSDRSILIPRAQFPSFPATASAAAASGPPLALLSDPLSSFPFSRDAVRPPDVKPPCSHRPTHRHQPPRIYLGICSTDSSTNTPLTLPTISDRCQLNRNGFSPLCPTSKLDKMFIQ